jgi:hypothetical protein
LWKGASFVFLSALKTDLKLPFSLTKRMSVVGRVADIQCIETIAAVFLGWLTAKYLPVYVQDAYVADPVATPRIIR